MCVAWNMEASVFISLFLSFFKPFVCNLVTLVWTTEDALYVILSNLRFTQSQDIERQLYHHPVSPALQGHLTVMEGFIILTGGDQERAHKGVSLESANRLHLS